MPDQWTEVGKDMVGSGKFDSTQTRSLAVFETAGGLVAAGLHL